MQIMLSNNNQIQNKIISFQSFMRKLNHWTEEEDNILQEGFAKFKSRKWKNIVKMLSQKNFQRTEAECRQRYVNHLDPVLNKSQDIDEHQLKILYEKYKIYGPKWCHIQTFLPNRSQIRIKNIFYGNIRIFLKKLYKYFTKRTAVFINQLKTEDLQSIFDGKQQFSNSNLLRKSMKKINYKINQQTCYSIISSNRQEFFKLLNKIIEQKTKMRLLNNSFLQSQVFNIQGSSEQDISIKLQPNKSKNQNSLQQLKYQQNQKNNFSKRRENPIDKNQSLSTKFQFYQLCQSPSAKDIQINSSQINNFSCLESDNHNQPLHMIQSQYFQGNQQFRENICQPFQFFYRPEFYGLNQMNLMNFYPNMGSWGENLNS